MEYIASNQFILQPKEVQKAFLDWWKPSIGDLFLWIQPRANFHGSFVDQTTIKLIDYDIMSSINLDMWSETCMAYNSITDYPIPLLTEGQLRKFIEVKIQGKIEFVYVSKDLVDGEQSYYRIERCCFIDGDINNSVWKTKTDSLMEAYWQVACKLSR